VDVCNGVMDKMGYSRGLVRYATQNSMALGLSARQMWARVLRPRVLVYTGVLLLICIALAASLVLRAPFKVDIVRDRAALARQVEDGRVENSYRMQIMNATEHVQRYRVILPAWPAASIVGRDEFEVGPAQARWVPLSVQVPPEEAARRGPGAHAMVFQVERLPAADFGAVQVAEDSTFVIPR
jgi:polyferredoxin